VRLRKRDLRAPVKGDLDITFSEERISAHAGLELFGCYVRSLDLGRRLRRALGAHGLEGDYGIVGRVFALVALILIGGRRISHLSFLSSDPVVLRFAGLRRLPTDRSLAQWLKRFGDRALLALETLIRDLVQEQIERSALRRITIDLDGTVLRTGAKVEGAARGFNPHHPKDCSYYPLTAHVAQLGQILRVWNRPGNVNDSHNAVGFLRGIFTDLRTRFGRSLSIETRLDGAFFLPVVLRFLNGEADVDWAMKVPLWKWLGLREKIAQRRRWTRVDPRIQGFSTVLRFEQPGWPSALRVVVYRKRVFHRTARNFQLDLFSPDDGTYEYSAVATNLELGVRRLWHFMAGRGAHEKTLADLKHHCAFDAIPTNDRHANSAWQMLSVLTLNLVRSFQIHLGAPRRPRTWKRTYAYEFQSLQTLRFELIDQPARLLRPHGRLQLRFAVAPAGRVRITRALERLHAAA
jgi:hypothetical protein|tara:strand:- start:39 stop:1427 length:1389 start_codon:yes stop_codon:yes gene_type:complete